MPETEPYVSYTDLQAICPYIDQLGPGDDKFLTQRVNARLWFDAAVRAASGFCGAFDAEPDDRLIKANAYKAVAEILMFQITPQIGENAYQGAGARYAAEAESEISTMDVTIYPDRGGCRKYYLGVTRRG